jgi:hypothetical protein
MTQRTFWGGIVVILIVIIAATLYSRTNNTASPAAEAAFTNALTPIMAQTGTPSNFPALQPQRAAAICKVITTPSITDWTGTVAKIDTTNPAGAILTISVMPNVTFGTAPNATENAASNTLIASADPLYATVSKLTPGTKIRFSGTLFPSQPDCIQETGSDMQESMQTPNFLTKFTSLTNLS